MHKGADERCRAVHVVPLCFGWKQAVENPLVTPLLMDLVADDNNGDDTKVMYAPLARLRNSAPNCLVAVFIHVSYLVQEFASTFRNGGTVIEDLHTSTISLSHLRDGNEWSADRQRKTSECKLCLGWLAIERSCRDMSLLFDGTSIGRSATSSRPFSIGQREGFPLVRLQFCRDHGNNGGHRYLR